MGWKAVYAQGQPGGGIGGYDLKSPNDRVFALDYNSSGKLDHLCLYRPPTGTFWILRNQGGGNFTPVYRQGDPGNGIGGYDIKSPNDVAFAFDYESSGKLDHIVLYRPQYGAIFILRRQGSGYVPVYAQGHGGGGIGAYDLRSPDDRIFAFDYNHSGCMDHLALYRPGTGTIWILKRSRTNIWTPVYQQGDPGNGIGSYDLRSKADRAFAFDYDSSGKMDHIALYRPGTGTMWILRNQDGNFSPVYNQGDPGNGIGAYDLRSPADVAFAFDWDRSGKNDHICLYRPGTGTLWVLERFGVVFKPVYAEGAPGKGAGGYDMASPDDKVLAFDYDGVKQANHLVLYRSNGTGTIWILKHTD
ncbi:Fc.00g100720.m01.CDS01 [Cosmosporella sp. VM-42]